MFLKRTKSENKTMKSATERSLRNNTKDLGCEESYWCFPEYMWNSPSTYDPLTVLKATQSSVAFCGPSLVPGEDITSFFQGKGPELWNGSQSRESSLPLPWPLKPTAIIQSLCPTTGNSCGDLKDLISPSMSSSLLSRAHSKENKKKQSVIDINAL